MKKLKLILTNPCAENWEDMQQAGASRYCEQCEKNIVDLTTKSDAELIRFFKRKKDNVCGRLLDSQLNRELALSSHKTSWQWLLPLAMGAFVAAPVQAKELSPLMTQNDQTPTSSTAAINDANNPTVTVNTIYGKVVSDQTGEPLKGVKIKEKGFENVLALTDSAGRFKLDISGGTMDKAFVFELDDYSSAIVRPSNDMVIKLVKITRITLGMVSTVSVKQEPLYLVYAGKKSCTIEASRLGEIAPDWIEKVEVLTDVKATALYGSKAANGVVLIGIKEAYANKIDFSKKK